MRFGARTCGRRDASLWPPARARPSAARAVLRAEAEGTRIRELLEEHEVANGARRWDRSAGASAWPGWRTRFF